MKPSDNILEEYPEYDDAGNEIGTRYIYQNNEGETVEEVIHDPDFSDEDENEDDDSRQNEKDSEDPGEEGEETQNEEEGESDDPDGDQGPDSESEESPGEQTPQEEGAENPSEDGGGPNDLAEGGPKGNGPKTLGDTGSGGFAGTEEMGAGMEAMGAMEEGAVVAEVAGAEGGGGILAFMIATSPWSWLVLAAVIIILIIILIAVMGALGMGDTTPKDDLCNAGIKIVIDPGHISEAASSNTQEEYDQDRKNGTGSMGTSTNAGLAERNVNQTVAGALRKELELRGYQVILTKNGADDFISNRARGELADKEKADLLLKLHNDGNGPQDGIIFYHSNKDVIKDKWNVKNELGEYFNRRGDEVIAEDKEIAATFETAFKAAAGKYDIKYANGVKYPASYREHPKNSGFGYTYNIPTSLIEMSSMKVTRDAAFISKEENYSKLAKAIADGVEKYLPPRNSGCGGDGINGLESPPGMEGPNSKGYYLFPKGLDVVKQLYGAGNWRCNHWGSKTLNQVVYSVAKAFAEKYPKNKMQIGDFNSSGHITHHDGRDADIDIPGGMMVDGSGYNRELAIYAAKLFFETKTIRWIYYDDGKVNSTVNAWAAQKGYPGRMKAIGGHDDHFHVRLQNKYAGNNDAPSCPW